MYEREFKSLRCIYYVYDSYEVKYSEFWLLRYDYENKKP